MFTLTMAGAGGEVHFRGEVREEQECKRVMEKEGR